MTVLRADPEPGLEGQIDYGLLGSWTDPRTGRSQRIWAFVMVLSHSRHMPIVPGRREINRRRASSPAAWPPDN